ncbi:MAG: hypothetical protein NTU69_12395 [Proteobacteria bacterium]|nr:hypothetical protein [Pseudomonadota bacterium]
MRSKTMNKELKAAIVRKYGNQFLFAAAVGERESTISSVVLGHKVLTDEQKKHWARVLNVKDIERLFPEASKGK